MHCALDCQPRLRGSNPHQDRNSFKVFCSVCVPLQLNYIEYTDRTMSVGGRGLETRPCMPRLRKMKSLALLLPSLLISSSDSSSSSTAIYIMFHFSNANWNNTSFSLVRSVCAGKECLPEVLGRTYTIV